jgi:hypothetical protein
MTPSTKPVRHRLRAFVPAVLAAAALPAIAAAQDPKALVSTAVDSELHANRTDHTAFMYRDHDLTPEHDTLYYVVETPAGNLKKKLEDHGHSLSPDDRRADDGARAALMADPSAMRKLQANNSHDDKQAEEMLKLLPVAYIWSVAGEKGDLITLDFKPDPSFSPSSLEARVLSNLAGQVVIARGQNRIATIHGSLVDDVKFGFGIFGRLHKGGSFQVERREVAPRHWQVTETHVHLAGHALFFKSIGDQEDEVRSDFHISPAQTLQQADDILRKTN